MEIIMATFSDAGSEQALHARSLQQQHLPSKKGFPITSRFIKKGAMAIPAIFAKLDMELSSIDRRSSEKRRSRPRADERQFPVRISFR